VSRTPYDRGMCAYCGKNVPIYVPKDGDGRPVVRQEIEEKKEGRKILSKYYSPLSDEVIRERGYE
jgi:hypothetical protein